MTAPAFEAVLLRCLNAHYEATTADAWKGVTGWVNMSPWQEHCARCGELLHLIKTVTITLASKASAA